MSIKNFLAQRNVTAAFPSTLPDNTVQVSAAHSLDYTTFGQTWSALAAPVQAWTDIAASSNGQYLTACVNAGSIYCSMNYGQTWTVAAGTSSLAWSALAMSASGQYQVAAVNSGSIYYSSNYGVTWAASATVGTTAVAWSSVAMSASGAYVTATVNGASIWYSTTYGQTWLAAAGTSSLAWSAVAMSASGQYQVASVAAGAIYYSSTFGVSWTASSSSSLQWSSLAMSASGQYATALVGVNTSATVAAGYIFYSTNYGQSWTQTGTSNYWKSVTMSASGQYQLATTNFPSLLYNYGFNTTDVQGANVLDYATGLYGAQLINGATISTSTLKVGTGALSLTATASQYAQLPPFQMSSSYTGLTVAGWVNLSAGNAGNARFFDLSGALKNSSSQISGAGTAYTYCILYSGNLLHFIFTSNTSSGIVLLGSYTTPYTLGSWAHIAWVMTSTTWQFYVNGSLITPTNTAAVPAGYYLPPTSYNGGLYPNFFLGRSSWNTDAYATGFWDDFRLYTTALNATQVSALYNSNAGILGTLQYSSNFGQTWQSTSGVQANYSALAMSSSGQYVTGCINGSTMYQGITSEPNIASQSLTVAGTTQTGALRFLDGSVSTTAAPVLDYSTFGQNWSVVSGPSANTYSCGMSSTGQYITMTILGTATSIWYSQNYGQSWATATVPSSTYYGPAMSASGQYQVCGQNQGQIYVSSNYGQTWTATTSGTAYAWIKFGVSASGQYMCASSFISGSYPTPGIIYTSNNYGQTWTAAAGTGYLWQHSCCSASGQYQYAVHQSSSGGIFASTNYGQTWALISNTAFGAYFSGICCSASGQYVYAGQYNSTINTTYMSSNYGQTWSALPTISGCATITCSASGQYIVGAAFNTGILYYSTNYGTSWSTSSVGTNFSPNGGLAMSASGQYTIASCANNSVYQSVIRSPSIFSSGSIILGNALSTNNQPQIGYTQVGIGSTTNYASIGFASKINTICWTANGNVGIGTTAPISQLTIWNQTAVNTSANLTLVGYSTSPAYGPGIDFYCWFSAVTPQARIEAYDDSSYGAWMTFSTKIDGGGSNALRESMRLGGANGYVGIGTVNPTQPLTIYNSTGNHLLSLINPSTSTTYMSFSTNGIVYGMIGCDNSVGTGLFGSGVGYGLCFGTQTTNPISFSTNNIIRMTILSGGNVGIGSTTPTYKLDVNGDVRSSGAFCCHRGTFTSPVVANGSTNEASLSSFTGVTWNQNGVFLVTLRSPQHEGFVFYNVSFSFIVFYDYTQGYAYGNPVSGCVNNALTMRNVASYDIYINFVGVANTWTSAQTITYTYTKIG